MRLKESDIQRSVLDWLKAKRIFAVRLNNAPVPTRDGRFRPVSMKGLPDCHVDYSVFSIPVSVWVEFKTPSGRLSEGQKLVKEAIEEFGGFYFIVRSIDDMEKALEQVTHEVSRRLLKHHPQKEIDG